MSGGTLAGLIRLSRPKQCSKNLLVFCGLLLAPSLTRVMVLHEILAFVAFSLVSASVYMLNDVVDLEKDRRHPRKKFRPLPSGQVTIAQAIVCGIVTLAAGMTLAYYINFMVFALVATYWLLTLSYTFYFKNRVIFDVMIIASGFVLRAVTGLAAVAQISADTPFVTPWFLACVFFLALFLALCKRIHELTLIESTGGGYRPVLDKYTIPLLNQMVSVATSLSLMCYTLYVILGVRESGLHFSHPRWLVLTIPVVCYGVLRYLYIVYSRAGGGEPEDILLKDRGIQAAIVVFLALIIGLK